MRDKKRCVIVFILFTIVIFVTVNTPNAFSQTISCNFPIRIMPLGNSITFDTFGDIRPDGLRTGYRQSLWIALKDADYNMDFVGSYVAGDDATPFFDPDNEGHPGWRDDEIANGRSSDPGAGKLADWLFDHDPDIVLLHIGTNGLDPNPSDVESILNIIDAYSEEIIVILARIINRNVYSQITTDFNDNVQAMAEARIASGDEIIIVDMEDGAGIDYRLEADGGDMSNNLHPNANGYAKMAAVWFEALNSILPSCFVFSPFIFTHPNTSGVVDSTYTYQVGAIGIPQATYSLFLNPAGMSIDPVTGLIQWTPVSDQLGLNDVVVQAQNTAGVYTQNFTVSIRRFSEIIGTWNSSGFSGIYYGDLAAKKWTQMWSNLTPGDIAAGDFTGDGKADVASNWSSGLWYQNGATLGWTNLSNTASNRLTAGDVTGDGRTELIGTWVSGDFSGIWYGDFAAGTWTQMWPNFTPGDIAAGDFTGDGKADVASNWSSGLWYQNGATLGWTKITSTPSNRLTAGDVTGDGRAEIIGTWYSGGFSGGIRYRDFATKKWTQMWPNFTPGDIAAGYFTGDGKADVASNWAGGLWYQNGATFGWTKLSNTASNRLTAGDLNGN